MLNGSTIASFDDSGVVTYNHKDHLGSSNLRTDSMGAILKHIEYYPFGTKRSDIGSFDDLKHNFTGQYEDDESDLLYYKQRYYDPQLGRFISADPLYLEEMDERGVNSQELNLYAYVGNNPLNRKDPTGFILEKIFTGDLSAHSEQAVSYSTFIASIKGKDLDTVLTEGGHSISSVSADGPKVRYVADPANPNNVIDMRHFIVVGKMGETAGLLIELLQSISSDPEVNESAFDPQDFFSNDLGSDFFSNYDQDAPLDAQLDTFFDQRASDESTKSEK